MPRKIEQLNPRDQSMGGGGQSYTGHRGKEGLGCVVAPRQKLVEKGGSTMFEQGGRARWTGEGLKNLCPSVIPGLVGGKGVRKEGCGKKGTYWGKKTGWV